MDLRLENSEEVRITGDSKCANFIDVGSTGNEMAITVDAYTWRHYIEIRKKEGNVRMFLFKKKGYKKDYNFGYWENAEVIFALNEVNHD